MTAYSDPRNSGQVKVNNNGVYEFTTPHDFYTSRSETEVEEIVEEEFDAGGKLISRRVTKTTKTRPVNDYVHPWTDKVQY